MRTIPFIILALLISPGAALAQKASEQEYEVPPTNSTTVRVPVISDAAMKECVKIYNEAKWLAKKLDGAKVDRYSRKAVNEYNDKVKRHQDMTGTFNRDCAGKQSESAYKAAQELNKAQEAAQKD